MRLLYLTVLMSLGWLVVAEAQTIPRPNIAAPQGLAVNSYTGNLFVQRNEQSLRGTGYRIYQSFYYNAAQDTLNYGYGHGWSFYYNIFYQEAANQVVIYRADAKKDTFLLSGNTYRSPAGVFDVLTKTGSQFTLTMKDGSRYEFADASHKKITRMQDANGNFVTLSYTGGNPTQITNSSGRSLLLTWTNGLLSEAKDSSEPTKKFTYQYSAAKDLVTVTDPLQGKKTFVYTKHYLIRLNDENNSPVVINYYGTGGKVKQITSCNTEQRFSFLNNPRKTYVTQKSESGNVVTGYSFDATGRLSGITDPAGNHAEFTYDVNNNLLSQKDTRGQLTSYAYDSKGNILKMTDPLGNATEYTYESVYNHPASVKDAKGRTTTLSYDAKGNLTSVVRPGNLTSSFTYDAAGRRLTATNANNSVTGFEYNTNGDLIKIQYPVGAVQYQYNGSCCNVGKITDANGSTIEMTYDALNRPLTVKDKQGNTTSYVYDAVGNVLKETDPNGNVKEYGYDGLNRLTSVKMPVGTWTYDYDGQNNLIKMTDANGHVTKYAYDKKQQLTSETDPLNKVTAYSYDVAGNLIRRNDPNGNAVNYKYDALDRLIEKSYPGNTDKYSYDEVGNLISAYNENIAYSFEYDNLNRMLKKNILTWNKSLSYTYDAVGNRKTMTNHDGGVTTYTYDTNNRLTKLTNPANLTTTFAYDAGGRISKQTNGNGTFSTYHYDPAGRLDSLTNWKNSTEKISFFYYTFDQYGNRKTLRDKRGLHSYTYDAAHRLTNVVYADGSTESFTLDGSGNRTQRIKNGVATPYTYNAADQIQTAGPTSFTFDANGNTIGQNNSRIQSYRYDGENRLLNATLNSQRSVQYKYDPFGDKIEKIDTLLVTTRMVYDDDNLLGELSTNNVTQNIYTTAFGMDRWLSMQTGGNNYFYHKDGLNSTVELTGTNTLISEQYSYDIYGNLLSQSGNVPNRVMYTGRLYEDNMNLYDYRARFYDPFNGRFNTKDNIDGFIDSPVALNKFSYAGNNPVNYVDQDGNSLLSSGIFFGGAIAIGAIAGLEGAAAIGLNAAAGALSGLWDTYWNPDENNQTWQCYLYNAGIGGAVGAIPLPKIASKFPKIGALAETYEKGLKQFGKKIVQTSWSGFKYEAGRRGLTVALALPVEYAVGQGLEGLAKFGAGKEFENPCKKPKEPQDGAKDPLPKTPDDDPTKVPIITPSDPNEIVGPAGYDSTYRWVALKQNLPYKVLFENDPDFATAPAQNVTVYVPIHPKLNPASLRISDFGFGSFNFSVPANTSVYTNRLDVRDSLGVFVDVTAGVDIANRRAFWIFQSIDPATGLSATLPANSGFLPVNDTTRHNGEGYVTFTLQPSSLAQTRDTVTAQASIIFDSEETIKTNKWVNTVDAKAPSSQVRALPPTSLSTAINLSWDGQEDTGGSGLRTYDLYASENNGPFILYQGGLTSSSTSFTGSAGSSYRFYTLAYDNVGNKEEPPVNADAQITVGCITPSLSITPTGTTLTCASPIVSLSAVGVGSVRWSTGATTASISVSIAGTYSVTLTSANGCTATASTSVSAAQAAPSVSISPSSATLTCASPTRSLSVIGVGSVRWSTGATTATISVSVAGTYSVTLTNANGCTATASASVSSAQAAPAVSISPSSATLTCASPIASLSVIGTGSVRWSTGATTASISVSIAGTYSVTLTNANGCTATTSSLVSAAQNAPSVSISPLSTTLTCATRTVSLSVVGVGSSRWSTGATTSSISASVAGTYSVTLTNTNGCTATSSVSVSAAQSAPSVNISPSSATLTCASPTASLSAIGTGSVRWSTGATTASISVSVAGTYSVTLTNANGCTATASTSVSAAQAVPSISISPSSATLTCSSPMTSLSVVGTGSVRWSTGATTASISVSTAGTYSATLTNANGCTAVANVLINAAQGAPTVSISPPSATLTCASPTVSLSVIGVGSMRWSTGATTSTISVSVTGTYSVTLTNTNGCIAIASATVVNSTNSMISTVKNGSWDDPATWSCGRVPREGDTAVIQHVVNIPINYTGSVLTIRYNLGGQLIFGQGSKIRSGF